MTGERWSPAFETDAGPAEDRATAPTAGGRGADVDGTTHLYHLDPEESPPTGVVSAVAAVTGQEPTSLVPLYDAVDPDSLAGLLGERAGDAADDSVRVTFAYAGFSVTVDSTGRIRLAR